MRANEGFSLVEVMLYVGITGFITTIAFAYSISGLTESVLQSEIDVLKSAGRVSTIWSIASGVTSLNHGVDGDEVAVTVSKMMEVAFLNGRSKDTYPAIRLVKKVFSFLCLQMAFQRHIHYVALRVTVLCIFILIKHGLYKKNIQAEGRVFAHRGEYCTCSTLTFSANCF